MPLYEYECPKDGTFEKMQKFSDPPLTKCPTCGGPIEKLLSAPAIQFKGTGWYVTDYAKKSGGPEPARSTSKDSGSKETSAKESSSKDSSSRDSSSKESSSKDSSSTSKTDGGSKTDK